MTQVAQALELGRIGPGKTSQFKNYLGQPVEKNLNLTQVSPSFIQDVITKIGNLTRKYVTT